MKTMLSDNEKMEIISEKVEKLCRLYELASTKESFGPIDPTNDVLILLRYTMSLERQVRQLQEDVKWILSGQTGPRPEVIGGKRKEEKCGY